MKKELFYVGASRGRNEIGVVTSDREQLRQSLSLSSARSSATELTREPPPSHVPECSILPTPIQGIEPGVARHEIRIDHNMGLSL
jgi:hypothetical protein